MELWVGTKVKTNNDYNKERENKYGKIIAKNILCRVQLEMDILYFNKTILFKLD